MVGTRVDRKLAQGRPAAVAVPVQQHVHEFAPLMCDHGGRVVAEEPIEARERAGRKFFQELGVVADFIGREIISQHAGGISRTVDADCSATTKTATKIRS